MNFFSIEFAFFIFILFIVYWILPGRYRNMAMLAGGYVFYAFAGLRYTVILGVFTVSSFFFGKTIEKQRERGQNPKAALVLGILIPLCTLFVFKYLDFAIRVVSDISNHHFNAFQIILPLGISFYTFQVTGYLIDIYRGHEKAEKNFITYAAYIAFFPQLTSGPIARTKTILPQFRKARDFNYSFAVYGAKRFAVGFFQKYFIANRLGEFVDTVYGNLPDHADGILILTTVFYTLQIYFDFCGYTHMVTGISALFNIKLDENFNAPYFSQSIRSFWARWHISLTSWLRDYVYIPLGGNRCGKIRSSMNVFITFLISGLWHGANYTFLIWGALHGAAQIAENLIGGKKIKDSKGIPGLVRMLAVFIFVNFAWIFFRAPDVQTAITMISRSMNGLLNLTGSIKAVYLFLASFGIRMWIAIGFAAVFGVMDYRLLHGKKVDFTNRLRTPVRWAVYILAMFVTMLLATGGTSQFIYVRF